HGGRVAGVGVHDAAVLDVGGFPDGDLFGVAAQHRCVPDVGVRAQLHSAEDAGGGGDEGLGWDLRLDIVDRQTEVGAHTASRVRWWRSHRSATSVCPSTLFSMPSRNAWSLPAVRT